MSNWQEWRVADVDMPRRLRNVLMNYDKEMTLGQLYELPEREARAIPRMGATCWNLVLQLVRDASAGNLKKVNKTLGEAAWEVKE